MHVDISKRRICVYCVLSHIHAHPGPDLTRSSNGQIQKPFFEATLFRNMWLAKDKREFIWKLMFQGRTACNLIDACYCFAGKYSIHLHGRNLTLRRKCSQRPCSKRYHIPENNIFYSYEKFSFSCWLMINPLNANLNPICHLLALLGAHHILHVSRVRVNIDMSSAFQNLEGIHTFKVCILNLGTRCKWALSITPQPFLIVWEKVGSYRMGRLLGSNRRFERF